MPLSDTVFKQLEQITGPTFCTRKKEECLVYSYDAAGDSHLPDAVVFPGNEDQVSQIMALATRHRFPVIPRGSGSGMTGGAIPVMGGVVMVFNRMNRIIDIDTENMLIRVEPGVITQDIHKAVEKLGLFYPPDPASSAVCTIGGNIGECAGGPRAVKYGVTRDYVLGLRAVLPSGNIITTGVDTAKGVAGYDLTRLLTGSEGTLAVVTQVTLKLLPKPAKVKTLAVLFEDIEHAARTVSGIMNQALIPRCVEFLDEASINLVRDYFEFDVPRDIRALLIIEVDGSAQMVESDFQTVQDFCTQMGAAQMITARTPEEAASLWKGRKALSPALYRIANTKINEDIVVPIKHIPTMVRYLENIQKDTGLTIVSFGHAGDGNIHCNIMYDKTDEAQTQLAKKAVDDLFRKTLALGGTITGEHGVGTTKQKYLPWELDDTQIALMKGIKQVFDPDRILNPGKIFL
ncbi:MAG: FAD-binding protein [Desulfobacteraceae bacterium]|nr:MAG: FAD-binding protein [Desulfobacteraceae bacterium]